MIIKELFESSKSKINGKYIHWILFSLILVIGIFARTWEFRTLPNGLLSDEASIGVDSYYIGKFGIDRNGVSFPMEFTAFGQEQNVLYGYLLVPFIEIGGLKADIIRLPMLIFAILTLPLLYFVARRVFDKQLGLLSMFFLAISPWHIMLARIALDQNLLPLVFTLGFAFILMAIKDNKWIIPSFILFALCFYIYGPSYFIVPFFLATSLFALIKKNLIRKKFMLIGTGCFGVLSIPIALFIIVNTFGLNSIHIGLVTIPRMPSQARFLSETGGLHSQLIPTLLGNLWTLLKLLMGQTDGLIYNAFEPYGYFYKVTFPIALIGMFLLWQQQKSENDAQKYMLFCWLSGCLIFGVLQPININRLNSIFIPLILCVALGVDWIGKNLKPLYIVAICGFLIAFISFTIDYHGQNYRTMADYKFHAGFLSAIQFASKVTDGQLCITDETDQPYIYVLFLEKPTPASYLSSVQYTTSTDELRHVESFLRYTFGRANCVNQPNTVYILRADEGEPKTGIKYSRNIYYDYYVYYPKP